jgi:hypothetical protein
MNLIPTYDETKNTLKYSWGILYLFLRFNMKHAGDYVNDFKKTFLQDRVQSQRPDHTDTSSQSAVSTNTPKQDFIHSENSAFESLKEPEM